jgi:membrane associated rhomboid family serine protease
VLVSPPQAAFGFLIGLVFFWWVVAPFEERYGARRTLQLCLVGALSGSLLALGAGQLFPAHSAHVFGINPIIIAAIAAFAWSIRNSGAPISFFGVLPMRPVHLILLVIGLSVLFFLIDKNVAGLAADLGATGGGILFVEWMTRPRNRPKKPTPERKRPSRSSPFRVIKGGGEGSDSDEDRPRWLN